MFLFPCILIFWLCCITTGMSAAPGIDQEKSGVDAYLQGADRDTVKIGVLANRGDAIGLREWTLLAQYLTREIDSEIFTIVPMSFRETLEKVANREVSYIIVNSSYYAFLEYHNMALRIATLQTISSVGSKVNFGGVVFTTSDRNDINELKDLRKKRFAAVDENSLGGWHAAWYELEKSGLKPRRDFSELIFSGSHDGVVYDVLQGRVDAGTVITGQIEKMAAEGRVDINRVKIINPLSRQGFPFLLSTDLYPEWPFAALPHVCSQLSKEITIALLKKEKDDAALLAAGIAGWDIPQDYDGVRKILQELELPPFEDFGKITLWQVLRQYQVFVGASFLLLMMISLSWVYMKILNRKLKRATLELAESEKQFRVLYENSSVSIIVHDAETSAVIRANEKAITSYGFTTFEELQAHNLWGESPYSEKEVEYWFKKVIEEGPQRFEWKSQTLTGDVLWEDVLLQKVQLKGVDYIISTAVDISDKKERELLQKKRLEKEVEIARNTLQFKQKFLANMSHEIRTPLTGVLGMVEILSQTSLDEQQMDYLATLKVSGENLREVINQVLDYSKLEAGRVKLNPRNFRLAHILSNGQKLFSSLCTGKSIAFHTTIDPRLPNILYADEIRIMQVINNFVSNAVKFTSNGEIFLSARLAEEISPDGTLKVEIKVQDTGQGISSEKQEKLFVPFSQVEESDMRHNEGTGLGLAICSELAGLLGGAIGVESLPGKGSTFRFTFNAREACADELKEEVFRDNISQESRSLRILFAEDKIINQKVVSLMLNSLGHTVILANNGNHALELFKLHQFDLILMDIQMPLMDGITATRILKQKYKNKLPPIVGLSANAFEGDREKYMALGLDEYITKPFKKEDLEKLFRNYF